MKTKTVSKVGGKKLKKPLKTSKVKNQAQPLKQQQFKGNPQGNQRQGFFQGPMFRITSPNIRKIGHNMTAQLPRYRKAG